MFDLTYSENLYAVLTGCSDNQRPRVHPVIKQVVAESVFCIQTPCIFEFQMGSFYLFKSGLPRSFDRPPSAVYTNETNESDYIDRRYIGWTNVIENNILRNLYSSLNVKTAFFDENN